MSDSLVLVSRDDDVVTLSLNNPKRRNSMNESMGQVFREEVAKLCGDDSLRAVVLTGAAEGRAFCAGGDLGMIGGHADRGTANPGDARANARDTMKKFYELFLSVRDLPVPTVAAINGHAIGAGMCITLGCDLRVADATAKLAFNFSQLGIHPGMGATWTLPRLLGPALAADLLYTGRTLSGEEAAAIGLVNRAVPRDDVLAEATALARQIATSAPLPVRGLKQALRASEGNHLDAQLTWEAEQQALCYETEDMHEGLSAAREKRAPSFKGR
ncbi:MAG: enoyl-CoA hydratase/isomerase family protein [Deltaproteobacteria bacterium]|nr:enoyl-CoA hydratase/isomerase family protein [Deltaproteobacteria bacterium]MBW2448048.1 enoyl-CoA hydratase/isomerase family protein [Deltaproteobacteria bacterium]